MVEGFRALGRSMPHLNITILVLMASHEHMPFICQCCTDMPGPQVYTYNDNYFNNHKRILLIIEE